MTNAPALVVRHRRFTLVVALMLSAALATAAVGVSMELHAAGAGIGPILAPLVLVLLAGCLAKNAYDRWAGSNVRLTVSAEGLTLPGIVVRPIPWPAVRAVRGLCCNPTPDYAATPRQYVLFEVEEPEGFGACRRGRLRTLAAPLPAGAPPITLDLSELDADQETVLAAVHRFHPAAVAGDALRDGEAFALANEASLAFASFDEVGRAAGRARATTAALLGRRVEFGPAVTVAGRDAARRIHAASRALCSAAATFYCDVDATAHRWIRSIHQWAETRSAATTETLRRTLTVIRHRLVRGTTPLA